MAMVVKHATQMEFSTSQLASKTSFLYNSRWSSLTLKFFRWGAPAFISFPHFYNADPSYREAVVGMNPQSHLHPFVLDLEPVILISLKLTCFRHFLNSRSNFRLLESLSTCQQDFRSTSSSSHKNHTRTYLH